MVKNSLLLTKEVVVEITIPEVPSVRFELTTARSSASPLLLS
jgi:hypothetical protein